MSNPETFESLLCCKCCAKPLTGCPETFFDGSSHFFCSRVCFLQYSQCSLNSSTQSLVASSPQRQRVRINAERGGFSITPETATTSSSSSSSTYFSGGLPPFQRPTRRARRHPVSPQEYRVAEDQRVQQQLPPPNLTLTPPRLSPSLAVSAVPPYLEAQRPPQQVAVPAITLSLPAAPSLAAVASAPVAQRHVIDLEDEGSETKRQRSAPPGIDDRAMKLAVRSQIETSMTCMYCQEIAKFPVKLPCGLHYVCFACGHRDADTKKIMKPRAKRYTLVCECTICNVSVETNDCKLATLTEPDPVYLLLLRSAVGKEAEKEFIKVEGQCPYCAETNANIAHVRDCGLCEFTCPNECAQPFDVTNPVELADHMKHCKWHKCNKCSAYNLTESQLNDHNKWEDLTHSRLQGATEDILGLAEHPILHSVDLTKPMTTICDLLLQRVGVASLMIKEPESDISWDEKKQHHKAVELLKKVERGMCIFRDFLDGTDSIGTGFAPGGVGLPELTLSQRASGGVEAESDTA